MSAPWERPFRWLPRIGWFPVSAEEALELDLEQATRWRWELFGVEWLNHGVFFRARAWIEP